MVLIRELFVVLGAWVCWIGTCRHYRQQCEGKIQKVSRKRREREREIMSINVCGNQTDPVGGDVTTSWEYNVTLLFFFNEWLKVKV